MLTAFFAGAAVWVAVMLTVVLLSRFPGSGDPGALFHVSHVIAPAVLFIVFLCISDHSGPPFCSVGGFFAAMAFGGLLLMTIDETIDEHRRKKQRESSSETAPTI